MSGEDKTADEPAVVAPARRKLLDSKERWAREGRLLTGATAPRGARLPPGQHRVADWPVLDLGTQPTVAPEAWRLAVDGLVATPRQWSWEEFRAEPQERSVSDMHCVTAWSRFDNRWEGVAGRRILALVQPLPAAAFVVLHGYDGYTTNLPLEDFDDDDVVLAHSWEGKPLTRDHGGPVRIVVPKLYLWKSAKWIQRIEFLAADRPGFWEEHGYHDRGDPWTEQRYR